MFTIDNNFIGNNPTIVSYINTTITFNVYNTYCTSYFRNSNISINRTNIRICSRVSFDVNIAGSIKFATININFYTFDLIFTQIINTLGQTAIDVIKP